MLFVSQHGLVPLMEILIYMLLIINYFVKGNIPFQAYAFHIGIIQVVMNTSIDPFKKGSTKRREGSNLDVKTLF